jgi:D-alanyl-lipoteichoic acid acyltransferase DltB (MBOAT superfamily)
VFLLLRYAPFARPRPVRAGLIACLILLPVFLGQAAGASYFSLRMADAALAGPFLLQAALFTTFASGPVLLAGRFWVRPHFRTQDAWLVFRGLTKLLVVLPVVMHFESGLLLPLRADLDGLSNIARTALYFYARLFLDFSGYSDCITGLSGLLGVRVRNNFSRPYLASSLRAFWLRWHATLGDFFRRHMIATGKTRPLSILAIFLLIGAWHGSALHFPVWGALHGTALLLEKRFLYPLGMKLKSRFGKRAARIYGTALTQIFVAATWIVFFWK